MKLRSLGLAVAVVMLAAGCKEGTQNSSSATQTGVGATVTGDAPAAATPAPEAAGGKVHKLASGLQYEDVVVGSGKMAEPGMNVSVHYTGYLTDEAKTKFDSSLDRGQPFQFQLGAGQVIQGWDEGVKGMRIGGKRKLTIPPDLGYGARGASGVIPPNATLLFDVELIDVK
jgi:FKBP-type peptidyl-prolyl cis-trans isomerase